jgi:hypothetical protein
VYLFSSAYSPGCERLLAPGSQPSPLSPSSNADIYSNGAKKSQCGSGHGGLLDFRGCWICAVLVRQCHFALSVF